jgi:hypothetical protein
MNALIAVLLLIGGQHRYLSSVEIGWRGTSIHNLDDKNIVMHLDLGETLENQTIRLIPGGLQNIQYRVEIRYQTSLTVMNEGPHLDLLDWKHHTSAWRILRGDSSNTYLMPQFTKGEWTRFPQVSTHEIHSAVLKRSNKQFAERVRNIRRPTDYPCGVSISKYFIRISAYENGKWIVLNILEFTNPMGC